MLYVHFPQSPPTRDLVRFASFANLESLSSFHVYSKSSTACPEPSLAFHVFHPHSLIPNFSFLFFFSISFSFQRFLSAISSLVLSKGSFLLVPTGVLPMREVPGTIWTSNHASTMNLRTPRWEPFSERACRQWVRSCSAPNRKAATQPCELWWTCCYLHTHHPKLIKAKFDFIHIPHLWWAVAHYFRCVRGWYVRMG